MRIAIVSANFRPHVGGIERFVEILAMELGRRGHEITVACCRYNGAPRQEELDGFSLVRVPAAYGLDRRETEPYPLTGLTTLVATLHRVHTRADVVHSKDMVNANHVPNLLIV